LVNDRHAGIETRAEANGRLTGDAVALYKFTVENPQWSEAEALTALGLDRCRLRVAIDVLNSLGLFRPSADPSHTWHAVGPETAIAEVLIDEETELRRRQADIASVRREILCLAPAYYEARRSRYRTEAVDVIRNVPTARRLLTYWSRRAGKEICIAHPGSGMSADGLRRSLDLDIPVLEKGVAMRTVLQHSTRHHLPTRQYAAKVAPLGAEIRTVPIVPRRMIVFDSEVAFVPLEGGRPEQGAAVVKEPAVIDCLMAFFELLWTTAKPYPVGQVDRDSGGDDELRQVILEHLAMGFKDDVIARRLGLSVRTCRRHIAALMERLHATSRFQAGVLARERGMLGAADREPPEVPASTQAVRPSFSLVSPGD
jgi:hypothetical protein